jgi:hypothetical protein
MGHRAWIVLTCALVVSITANAQILRNSLPIRSLGGQFAGSVGLYSVNAMLHDRSERFGIGLGAGHVPHGQGGPINTFTFRGMYTPWSVDFRERWRWEPIQTGLFIAYSTGLDLEATWPSYLEKGYYWWSPNFRQHLFMRSQLSYRMKERAVQRVAVYFEMNTNDLYVYSWWPNRRSLSVYDIVFFGAGVQVYLAPLPPRSRKKAGPVPAYE